MIASVMLALCLEAGPELVTGQALPPAVATIAADANSALLAGEGLPSDYRLQLLNLPPDERILAIIYLRRTGMLQGTPWSVDDILRPAIKPDGDMR